VNADRTEVRKVIFVVGANRQLCCTAGKVAMLILILRVSTPWSRYNYRQ
jgi:hypothetical protein